MLDVQTLQRTQIILVHTSNNARNFNWFEFQIGVQITNQREFALY